MPNDNTHTLLPCPFCGSDALAGQCRERGFYVGCVSQDCEASVYHFNGPNEAAEAWNTRTPAEPKAGDWEEAADQLHDAIGLLKLGDHPDKVFGEYVFPLFRALSSAAIATTNEVSTSDKLVDAPRITEGQFREQVEHALEGGVIDDPEAIRSTVDRIMSSLPAPLSGITGDSDKSDLPIANSVQLSEEMVEGILDGIRVRGNTDRHHGIRTGIEKAKVAMIALLRQQGAERKWISFGERLPDLGQPIFAKIRDSKSKSGYRVDSADFPKDMEPLPGMSIREWVGLCDWEAWTPRFVDTPPPFTPTQTEE